MAMVVRPLSPAEHLEVVARRGSASFLQCPSWGAVKREWRHESIGWIDADGSVAGAGLVLYRELPGSRRALAYLPEGPVLPWDEVAKDVGAWMSPLADFLRVRKAFAVRMGPPVEVHRWEAATVKAAIAAGRPSLGDTPADETGAWAPDLADGLRDLGWQPPVTTGTGGFSAGQPRFVFALPLAGRSLDEVSRGMNQLWRRNIKKAEKSGVTVREGGEEDLPAFHALYAHTAGRDHFTPRPLAYFQRMWVAMRAEDPRRIRLYLAEHEGELLAATTMVTVGTHAWYSYGASASHKREVRPSNAVQWRMIQDAHAAGCEVYDLRGITDTLDQDDHLFGLIQFKVGTGGHALDYLGEWDLPLSKVLSRAFALYMSRR